MNFKSGAAEIGRGRMCNNDTSLDTPRGVLQAMFGFNQFKPGQEEAINAILESKDTIVIIPTGGGKTIVYTIPCVMQPRLSIVIPSLVMLMHDQVARLRQEGINTCFYNRLMKDEERKFVLHNLQQKECQYESVFASPEGLFTESCLKCLMKISELDRLQCFIVDEAHCISTWGKDFRKDYARLGELKKISMFSLLH